MPQSPSQRPSLAGYAENAAKLLQDYEKQPFEKIFRGFTHVFPVSPSRVLDLGAGSGRHASALARMGHEVVAVEPVREMREGGQEIHRGEPITWLDDVLPELPLLRSGPYAKPYDCVLLAGVMMHFDADEREEVFARVKDLVAPGGTLISTWRHGPVPAGRRMFDVPLEEAVALGARHGFTYVDHAVNPDHSGRADVNWTLLCLRR